MDVLKGLGFCIDYVVDGYCKKNAAEDTSLGNSYFDYSSC